MHQPLHFVQHTEKTLNIYRGFFFFFFFFKSTNPFGCVTVMCFSSTIRERRWHSSHPRLLPINSRNSKRVAGMEKCRKLETAWKRERCAHKAPVLLSPSQECSAIDIFQRTLWCAASSFFFFFFFSPSCSKYTGGAAGNLCKHIMLCLIIFTC